MFNLMNAQSEIARRREFASSGMQAARVLSSLVLNLVRQSREILVKAVSDRLAPEGHQVSVQSQVLQS